jgi:hypothetical protein
MVYVCCKNGYCAAKAFCYCPAIISHNPKSQNILKEQALNPEKDSRIKSLVAGLLRPRLFPFGKLSKLKSAAQLCYSRTEFNR